MFCQRNNGVRKRSMGVLQWTKMRCKVQDFEGVTTRKVTQHLAWLDCIWK